MAAVSLSASSHDDSDTLNLVQANQGQANGGTKGTERTILTEAPGIRHALKSAGHSL